MDTYQAPIEDMLFILNDVIGWDRLPQVSGGELDGDMAAAILTEAGKLAADILAPLNHTGDQQGSVLQDGSVTTPEGFKAAYEAYRDNGWNSVPFDPEYGGQGLPWALAFPVQEMWQSANMSFGLCPMLNQGAIEAIEIHADEKLKQTYLPKMISGEWTGTMNLTEPQAGTDLGAIRTKAEKQDDGTYCLKGQKIYITYGEHDFTPNIIHSVLARTSDSSEGSKGLSLFIVPKFIPDKNGAPGERNDVYCTGIEHKLGIHASPTCTMQYGDNDGAVAYLVGAENDGLKCMFTMMNNARLSVGLQGVAIAERAYQHALSYARDERVQGAPIDKKDGQPVHIIKHPDVARMLLEMRAQIEAARALTYDAALHLDLARGGDEEARVRVDLLTPVVKAWCTDMAVQVTERGKQVHGGMGFIEETGAAQYVRDANILTIYEGTNGVQAGDLVFRKVIRDKGAAALIYIDEVNQTAGHLEDGDADYLTAAAGGLQQATEWLLNCNDPRAAAAVSVPYLNMFGLIAGANMMGRSLAIAVQDESSTFNRAKIKTAEFYLRHILPHYKGYRDVVLGGSGAVCDFDQALFAS